MHYILNKTNSVLGNMYGIDIVKDNTVIKSFTSISNCRKDISKLADMCNELNIEPCHFEYIVEDYLTDYTV